MKLLLDPSTEQMPYHIRRCKGLATKENPFLAILKCHGHDHGRTWVYGIGQWYRFAARRKGVRLRI